MIPQQFIEEVQARTDIVDLISSYLPLKKAGRNFKALCPFHNEKTPSFFVSSQKQIFHCFGCGEGGGVVQFLILYEKINFIEAIEILANRLGLQIPYQESSPREKIKTILYEVVQEASAFFFDSLTKHTRSLEALKFLESRGITRQIVDQFRIGYAPFENPLIKYMRAKGFSLEILEKASLITSKKDGGYMDLFRGRIMLPIFDTKGRIVGFGARLVKDKENSPKYINSLENPLYSKREHLYGINFSKEEILSKDYVVIVEGYFDMIVPYTKGIKNIVASLGTALTVEQIRLIKRYTRNVVLVFDSDKAGELASLRVLDLLLENDLNIGIVKLPPGFDPDSLVREKGVEYFINLLSNRTDFFDYKKGVLQSMYDLGSIQGKSKVAGEMLSTIDKVTNEVEKYEYIKRLASLLKVKEEILLLELRKLHATKFKHQRVPLKRFLKEPVPITEKVLIQFIIHNKKAYEVIRRNLDETHFSHPLARKTVAFLYEKYAGDSEEGFSKLLGIIEDKEVSRFISELLMEEGVTLNKGLLKECIVKLRRKHLESLRVGLKKELEEAEIRKDKERVKELILKYKEVSSEVRRYGYAKNIRKEY